MSVYQHAWDAGEEGANTNNPFPCDHTCPPSKFPQALPLLKQTLLTMVLERKCATPNAALQQCRGEVWHMTARKGE